MKYVIGIDLGGTNLRIGAVEKNGNIHYAEKIFIAPFAHDVVNGIKSVIKDFMTKNSLAGDVAAISIGVPSAVSHDKSFIYSTPNIKGLNNINLGKILTEEFQLKTFIDRDVNFLLKSDIEDNNLDPKGEKTVLGIYVGTGIGNALYVNGNFYAGKNGVAGELGHIPMLGVKTVCGCGNVGCSETCASGRYLEHLCATKFSGSDIKNIFLEHSDDEAIVDFIDTLSQIIATEINIFDPDYVILSGGVVEMKNFPMDFFVSHIKSHMRKPYPFENIEFVFPQHNFDCGVKGGALIAWEKLETLNS